MKLRFLARRTVWWPTRLGWLVLVMIMLGPALLWWFEGESFLSETDRLPAEVLVIEAWIGIDGIHAGATEFMNPANGYQYIVVTGGLTASRWEERHASYPDMAKDDLIHFGIPADRIITAFSGNSGTQRTFQSAAAVWRAFHDQGLQPKGMNVFTLGCHGRRSRLIFTKVHAPQTRVGIVSWIPGDYEEMPWWKSSERSKEMLTESAGFVAEVLFNSGRGWHIFHQAEATAANASR